MEIHADEISPNTVAVTVAGKVMMGAESEKIENLVEQLLREGKRTIIFDLGGVTNLDSTGIGRFISSFNKIAAVGGNMKMAAATGHVFQTFHISMLDTVFPFYPTVEEAAAGN
jgi:anti-sigma B factor antagonist